MELKSIADGLERLVDFHHNRGRRRYAESLLRVFLDHGYVITTRVKIPMRIFTENDTGITVKATVIDSIEETDEGFKLSTSSGGNETYTVNKEFFDDGQAQVGDYLIHNTDDSQDWMSKLEFEERYRSTP
jgi:hypothetical protein